MVDWYAAEDRYLPPAGSTLPRRQSDCSGRLLDVHCTVTASPSDLKILAERKAHPMLEAYLLTIRRHDLEN
jgi:hypothetical protein